MSVLTGFQWACDSKMEAGASISPFPEDIHVRMQCSTQAKCTTRICTMTNDLTATAFSRPASIFGLEAIGVAQTPPPLASSEIGAEETLLAGEHAHI